MAILAFLLAIAAGRVRTASGVALAGVAADLLMVAVLLAFAAWVIVTLRMRKARA